MLYFTGMLDGKYYNAEAVADDKLIKHFNLPIQKGQPTTFVRTLASITRPDQKGLNMNASPRVSGYYKGESYEVIYATNRTTKGSGDPTYAPTRLPLGDLDALVLGPQEVEKAVILCLNDKCAECPSESKGSDPRITVYQQAVIDRKRSVAAQDRTAVLMRITGASKESLANTHAYFAYKGEFRYSNDHNTHIADLTEKAFADHATLASVLDSDNFKEKSIISKALLENKVLVGNKQGGRCATFVDKNHDLFIAPIGDDISCILSALQGTEDALAKFLFASISGEVEAPTAKREPTVVKAVDDAPVQEVTEADEDFEHLTYFDYGILIVKDGALAAQKEDGTYKTIKVFSPEEVAKEDFLKTCYNFAKAHPGYKVMIKKAYDKKVNK